MSRSSISHAPGRFGAAGRRRLPVWRWALTWPPGVRRHPGTNGWLSSWGTQAHGEIAGCPPGRPSR
ncbi:hypothetical protein FE391_26050 [Nonomuraea sp. KC401]|nr:hypothetical protein FE391_26050 [Nonomuraea sp. KC401]